ncbi:hypothetical protein H5968_23830 [Sphaerospermopsis sp. LEGE 00249]|uniref:hypothetical protein n=1 Tax=Sphaerospermopsis sp. LEGE 00249 TaxID=1380707 RepID=UPI00164E3553|nr:hypothetical protein [Sphaerospermopsis sp. LEGE 00249]MBC5798094.1 hypothetical protein [Sphaerospermopsis sp. LEGE 00249]
MGFQETAKKFSHLLLTPVRAKHSENSLFIKLIICRPNASPLRLLTPDSYALTERLSQQPLITWCK